MNADVVDKGLVQLAIQVMVELLVKRFAIH